MFVDASAIVAILSREPEADRFASLVENAPAPVTSPIAIFEAVLGLCRKRHASVEEANADVREFLTLARIDCVAIDSADAETALTAFARYGKGRAHPAQLNLGDCFAYAVARNRTVPLLFKGDDFGKTDIESAAN
jgi:ribonuclease VapC